MEHSENRYPKSVSQTKGIDALPFQYACRTSRVYIRKNTDTLAVVIFDATGAVTVVRKPKYKSKNKTNDSKRKESQGSGRS